MNERYPDGSLSHLYGAASNREETHLGLSVTIPTPDEVFPKVLLTRLGIPGSPLRLKTKPPPLDDLLAQITQETLHPAHWDQSD
jgi:hypothetical protein